MHVLLIWCCGVMRRASVIAHLNRISARVFCSLLTCNKRPSQVFLRALLVLSSHLDPPAPTVKVSSFGDGGDGAVGS